MPVTPPNNPATHATTDLIRALKILAQNALFVSLETEKLDALKNVKTYSKAK